MDWKGIALLAVVLVVWFSLNRWILPWLGVYVQQLHGGSVPDCE